MNRTLMQLRTKTVEFWRNRSKLQKILMIGGVAALAIIITVVSIFASSEKMVPLFRDLSEAEAGQIKQELDGKNVKSELANNGTTILVPEKQADTLKVTLASEGLPKTGNIDYSFFANNSGFGLTDNEFDVLKVDATQTELSNLINTIDGIKDSKVMINLPKDSVFVGEEQSNASASIVLQVQPGYTLTQQQVKGLYHLISKSVPNLKTENIVIMDQDSNYYDLNSSSDSYASGMDAQQQKKEEIEKNLQRKIQQLLGTMMGQEKVAVSVTTDIDFTEEKRKEDLVEPVDQENMQGIAVSAEKIAETYSGNGAAAGGTAGTGDDDVTNYQGADGTNGSGDYEKSEDRINYEVNRIHKDIKESPYKIRDVGIQALVEPPTANDPNSLTAERQDDIKKILSTIISTSIDKEYTNGQALTQADLDNKIVLSVSKLDGKQQTVAENPSNNIPIWVYIVGGVLLLAIIALIILLVRKRRKDEEEEFEFDERTPIHVPDIDTEPETEEMVRKNQLEKMAKDKPEDFAKLLRSWLSED
ncbi:flagellar basal-body MS-ring/collar protein FliF [Bacillus altitudinis]|uniref:flagellar basal-body MS-ring/collar protein FliF n=1 Tax=Bacillus altitudinis TaxID=293387 RepID=UPI00042E1D7F|nr:flagellar basal-body MS-ring/collar protein FliF [Bacillus altitudinis]AHL71411.1 flagellar M-ring protein FliF [Bacillus pumilus]OPX01442.1 flagellar M-ring protein FliF [Bacillus altitudinis]